MRLVLTDKCVRSLAPPATGNRIDYDVPSSARDSGFVRGFAVRTTAAGTKTFLLCYVTAEGRERRQKIGDYGTHTVTTARDEARKLRNRVDAGHDPAGELEAKRTSAVARRARSGATLGGMLVAYTDALERAKKPSAASVRRELRTSVERAHPQLWKKAADDVTLDDLVKVLNTLTRAGKLRQAEKTRSNIRAAYSMAAASRGSASTSDLFAEFANVPNIGRDLATIERPKMADDAEQESAKRALSQAELAAYWTRIKAIEGAAGALLRFHLLTGAQRCAQLARVTARNVDTAAKTATLLDGKGRRKKAREHVVPLLPEALAALVTMKGDQGPFVFTLDQGASGAGYHAVRRKVAEVAAAMVEAKETAESFTPGELRITVETRLAAAGIPMETRAQLQSHGLGGIQNKHYDKHTYSDEKRAALETLRALCVPTPANVTPIRQRKAG